MSGNKGFMDDQLAAMLLQEQKFYRCSDYLGSCSSSTEHPVPITVCPLQILNEMANLVTDTQLVRIDSSSNFSKSDSKSEASPTTVVHDMYESPHHSRPPLSKQQSQRDKFELSLIGAWRSQMFDWICQVVRFSQLNKGVVEVSFNILDRFLVSKVQHDNISREEFRLYCLASLHIAFKTSASAGRLSMKQSLSMSGGFYQVEEIQAAELEILQNLQWHVNPPTIMAFCDLYLKLHETQLSKKVYSACEYMAEVAIADEFFISKPCSSIALAITLLVTRKEGIRFAWAQKLLQELRGRVFVEGDEFESILQQLECLI
ncbi:unnamed protein product [Cylindrotheca closterium]|uniref:Cyclin-like domain-containing protein n=1 Tax=Cylindrotheca closterium TaxID=2856 RepID=A0AAD2CH87_9STRA|nr:unnamed protein product [Cylindrotheca closterium]